MLNNKLKHVFAFYQKNISVLTKSLEPNEELCIENKHLSHRIKHVLRLQSKEHFILFDRSEHIFVEFKYTEKKKSIFLNILKKEKNIELKPKIEFLLPLLKKDNFEASLYSLVELGAQTLQPLFTQKSQKKWKKELVTSRYLNIIISAAEQSKNFAFPLLKEPVELKQYINSINNSKYCDKIYFDPEGNKLSEILKNVRSEKLDKLYLMVGPEGDLTLEEKNIIRQKNFTFCKLTPTILRSFQAVAVGIGTFRSLL